MPRRSRHEWEEPRELWELRRRGPKPKAKHDLTDELLRDHPWPTSEITLHDWEPGFSARIRSNGLITFHYRMGGYRASRRIRLGRFPELSVGEARAKIARIQSHISSDGREPLSAYDPFSKAVSSFLWEGENKWSDSYLERSRRRFTNRLIPALGDIPIHRLEPDQIRAAIVDEKRSPTEIKNDLALVSSFLSWCMDAGALNVNKLRGSYVPQTRVGWRKSERGTLDGSDEALSLLNPRFHVPEPASTLLALVALTGFPVTEFLSVLLMSAPSHDQKFPSYTWGISFPNVRLGPLASRLSTMAGEVPPHLLGRTINATRRKIATEVADYAGDSHVHGSRRFKTFAKLVEEEISRFRFNLEDWEQHLRRVLDERQAALDEVVL